MRLAITTSWACHAQLLSWYLFTSTTSLCKMICNRGQKFFYRGAQENLVHQIFQVKKWTRSGARNLFGNLYMQNNIVTTPNSTFWMQWRTKIFNPRFFWPNIGPTPLSYFPIYPTYKKKWDRVSWEPNQWSTLPKIDILELLVQLELSYEIILLKIMFGGHLE